MYENHFGLKKRPFRASASGTDVFVGPQAAKTMSGIKKALSADDAVVTVSGPVGIGKTTLVNRALEGLPGGSSVLHIGRMHLGHEDLLEVLLDELSVRKLPVGTIQRFNAFRTRLKELAAEGQQDVITVEEGVRLGVDALAELEALTAADAGDSDGTRLVLMGDERLEEVMQSAPLARLKQRTRQRLWL